MTLLVIMHCQAGCCKIRIVRKTRLRRIQSLLDWRFALKTFVVGTAAAAAILTVALTIGNPGLSLLGTIELTVSALYIAILVDAVFLVLLLLAWIPVRATALLRSSDQRAFLVSGLIALHLGWALLNRLTLVLLSLRSPRFFTVPGLAQSFLLALGGICLVGGWILWKRAERRRWGGAVGVTGVCLWMACLFWNSSLESQQRNYPLTEVRAAAGRGALQSPPGSTASGEQRPVILLAFDGLSWNVMKPLLSSGSLPNFARLIRTGTIGYLDNGDLSYSPSIWNTIYSGRLPADHGIRGFLHPVFHLSREVCPNLLVMPPTLHTFYGLRHLYGSLPNAGLWRMKRAGSLDRKAPMVWDVASRYRKRVTVINPITSLPVQPVNGRMQVLGAKPDPLSAYPLSLVQEWQARIESQDRTRRGWRSFHRDPGALLESERHELDYSIALLASEPFDLGVLFTSMADTVAHVSWPFYTGGRTLIFDTPASLSDPEWEQLVLAHTGHPLFQAYRTLDDAVGRLAGQLNANYIVVSDHGWNFSGFEHYASPDGVIILSGPDFQAGAIMDKARIEDIAPTILGLLEIPLSRQLAGRPLTTAMRDAPSLDYIASYGAPRYPVRPRSETMSEEQLERLRALGYIH